MIKKNFKDAAEFYTSEILRGIHPMSLLDGEILSDVIDIIKARGGNDQLLNILKQYKGVEDVDILTDLRKYLSSLDEDGIDSKEIAQQIKEKKDRPIDFVQIGNETFQAWMLFKIRPIEQIREDDVDYGVILNEAPIPERAAYLEDKHIMFESEKARDEALKTLRKTLEDNENIRFL